MKSTTWIVMGSFLFAAAGFLWPFWPLSAAGILLAALLGYPVFAILLGLLLDVAYGAPLGHWGPLYVPFTILSVLGVLARSLGSRYLRRGAQSDRV